MNRCIDCDGLLTKEEKVCAQCGARVPVKEKRDPMLLVLRFVQLSFLLSFGAMIAGLFTDFGPGFLTSLLLACAFMVLLRTLKDRPDAASKRH